MNDNLTLLDVSALVRRCCTAYGRPFGTKAEALVALWFEKLRGSPASAVKAAVEVWVDNEARFPTVAGLRKRATDLTPKTDAERNAIRHDYACPQCHTEPRPRFWLVEKRSRLDERPILVVVEDRGREVEFVLATRDLCRCDWDGKRARGLTPLQRQLLDEADYTGPDGTYRLGSDGGLQLVYLKGVTL